MEQTDRLIFEHIDELNESISEETSMDVDVFFDLIEEMIENNYRIVGGNGNNQIKSNE